MMDAQLSVEAAVVIIGVSALWIGSLVFCAVADALERSRKVRNRR